MRGGFRSAYYNIGTGLVSSVWRICEICGNAAENITGIRDQRLVEEWNEARSNVLPGLESSEGCWRSQPYCNFLMACLVLAFVLPWFLRVNWFT